MASESPHIQLYSITTGECCAVWEGRANRSVLSELTCVNIVYAMLHLIITELVGNSTSWQSCVDWIHMMTVTYHCCAGFTFSG